MRRQLQRTPTTTTVDYAAVRLAMGCGSCSNAVSGVCSMSLNSLTEPRCLPRLAPPSGPATTAPKSRLPCWLRCRRFEGGFAGANSTWCAIPTVTSWALTAECASKHHDFTLLFVASCPSGECDRWHFYASDLLLFLMRNGLRSQPLRSVLTV